MGSPVCTRAARLVRVANKVVLRSIMCTALLAVFTSHAFPGYREDNIDLFRITDPPATTDHHLVGAFEASNELVVGWVAGVLDPFFTGLITRVWGSAPVVLLAATAGEAQYFKTMLLAAGLPQAQLDDTAYLKIETIERDTPWVGDFGPLPIHHVSTGKVSLVDPRYFEDRWMDDKLPTVLASNRAVNVFRPSVLLPRGVLTDGQGNCFLSQRDQLENLPDPDEAALAVLMEQYLGCTNVVILPPLVNAGTGDLSLAMRFISSSQVLVGSQLKTVDCVNRDRLNRIAEMLSGMDYDVHRVPFPPDSDGALRSYTELVLTNGAVLGGRKVALVPQYADYPDYNIQAIAAVSDLMAADGWEVEGIEVDALDAFSAGLASTAVNLPHGEYAQQQAPPEPVCGDQASCQASGCGEVTYEGLCAGDTVVWCQDSQILSYECSTPCAFAESGQICELQCGLAPAGYYDCVGDYVCGGGPIFADGFESGVISAPLESVLSVRSQGVRRIE